MTITVQALSQLPLFAGLGDDALREIVPHVREHTFSSGQVILLEGDPCQAVYLVVRGLVRTVRLSHEGREQVLAYLGPGELFNLVPALDGGSHLATVRRCDRGNALHHPLRALPAHRARAPQGGADHHGSSGD